MSGLMVILRADGAEHRIEVANLKEPSLQVLQRAVGGYIEPVVVLWEGIRRQAYVNEDGISKRLPPNTRATTAYHAAMRENHRPFASTLLGDVVIWIPDLKETQDDDSEAE
jgi:hypothetical protein